MILKPLNDLALIKEISAFWPGEAYLVGGCVRDWLLGQKCGDLDFLFDGYPEKPAAMLAARYGGRYNKFEKFLTVRVFLKEGRVDLARFRKEKYEKPASLPLVSPASSLREDLERRDFSVNAAAISLSPENEFELNDPIGALEDIKKGLIRVLHKNSFRDDPTRIFRAARFCSRFGWELAPDTGKWLRQAAVKKYPALLSRERIRNEILKILSEKKSLPALKLLEEWKVLSFVGELKLNPAMDSLENRDSRFAVLCAGAENPLEFLASMKPEKKLYAFVAGALKTVTAKRSPVGSETPDKEVLRLLYPRKKEICFEKLALGPAELARAGVRKFDWSAALEYAAGLKWRGLVRNEKEAIEKIKKKYASNRRRF